MIAQTAAVTGASLFKNKMRFRIVKLNSRTTLTPITQTLNDKPQNHSINTASEM